MQQVWPDSFVEEGNLTVNISALRRALGETPAGQQYIETIPKRGYRFVVPVTETPGGPIPGPARDFHRHRRQKMPSKHRLRKVRGPDFDYGPPRGCCLSRS